MANRMEEIVFLAPRAISSAFSAPALPTSTHLPVRRPMARDPRPCQRRSTWAAVAKAVLGRIANLHSKVSAGGGSAKRREVGVGWADHRLLEEMRGCIRVV
jgi:hypothetical protein